MSRLVATKLPGAVRRPNADGLDAQIVVVARPAPSGLVGGLRGGG